MRSSNLGKPAKKNSNHNYFDETQVVKNVDGNDTNSTGNTSSGFIKDVDGDDTHITGNTSNERRKGR